MAKFAAIVTFANKEQIPVTRPRHRVYLQRLLEQGKLHESGPFVDDTGALIVYEAANEAEARALMTQDPYAEAGIFGEVQLKEWTRVFP